MQLLVSVLVLLLLGDQVEGGDVAAHVQSEYGQLVTSSTLKWVRSGAGYSIPLESVSSGTNKGVMCRGFKQGVGVTGVTSRGRCEGGLNGKKVSLTSYEVLTQVQGASKLEWRTFERFSKVPVGAVAGVEGADPVFIARILKEGMMENAYLEMGKEGGFGRIAVYKEGEKVRVENICDLLVEMEPVRYELHLHPFDKKLRREKDRRVLDSTSIFRFDEGTANLARMQKMMFYQNEKSLYLGQIKGSIRGLPALVKMPSGDTKVIVWGMVEKDKQRESIMVGYDMPKNSAIDVEVVADLLLDEQPYTGILIAFFPDGSQREREVEGVMQNRYLDKIHPQYSKLYQIKEQVREHQVTARTLIHKKEETKTDLNSLSKKLQQKRGSEQELRPGIQSGGRNTHSLVLLPGLIWATQRIFIT